MIQAITVTNHLGQSLRLELTKPEASGLLVCNVEGLGPAKANVSVSDIASMDGARFNSSRVTTRNIVLTLAFLEIPMIEDARHKTYQYFPIKKRVKLEVETDRRTCYTYGYVESNEPGIFSQIESAQISILCPNSYFYESGSGNTVVFSGVDPLFEFPFSNEGMAPVLELGEYRQERVQQIEYTGDVDVGMEITMHCMGPVSGIALYHTDRHEIMRIDTDKITKLMGEPLKRGDEIVISTVPGEKRIELLRDGEYYNIINALDKNADWFVLEKGINTISYGAESGVSNLYFRINYRNGYQGA